MSDYDDGEEPTELKFPPWGDGSGEAWTGWVLVTLAAVLILGLLYVIICKITGREVNRSCSNGSCYCSFNEGGPKRPDGAHTAVNKMEKGTYFHDKTVDKWKVRN